jgi:hypothetical protein
MRLISGALLHLLNSLGSDKIQEQLRTHSTFKMTLQFKRKYSTQGSGAPCHVSFGFFSRFCGIILSELQIDPQPESTTQPKARGHISFDFKTTEVLLKTFKSGTRGRLGTTREDFKITQRSVGVPSSLGILQVFLRTFGL